MQPGILYNAFVVSLTMVSLSLNPIVMVSYRMWMAELTWLTMMSEFGSCSLTSAVVACEVVGVWLHLLAWVDKAALWCCRDEKRWEEDIILLAESSGEIIECECLVPALSDWEMVNGAPEMMVVGVVDIMVNGALEVMVVGKHWFRVDE